MILNFDYDPLSSLNVHGRCRLPVRALLSARLTFWPAGFWWALVLTVGLATSALGEQPAQLPGTDRPKSPIRDSSVDLEATQVATKSVEPFPIGFWYGPPPTANSLPTWRRVAEAHFNLVGPCPGYSLADNRKLLEYCERCQLRAIVVDDRVRAEMVADPQWPKTVAQVVQDYQRSPALMGYFLHDEPTARWFSVLAEMHAEFRQRDPARLPFINLFPNYATPDIRGTATYQAYLRQFVTAVRPTVISFDHYPLLDTGADRLDYFENLEAIRSIAQSGQTPVWSVIQLVPHNTYRDPTAAELHWQVFTSLAYGVKGLLYFTYWPPESLAKSAIVDAEGQPTPRYDMVRDLNRQVLAIGPVLQALRSTAVYHTGVIPQGGTRLPSDTIVQVPSAKDLVVGCFEDAQHREFVMIVNRDYRQPAEFGVQVRADVVGVSSFSSVDGGQQAVPVVDRQFLLKLQPGEGRLLAIQSHFADPRALRPTYDIKFEFTKDAEEWLAENSLSTPTIENGVLEFSITGTDPYLTRGFLGIAAGRYRCLVVRMKTPGQTAELYWQTAEDPRFDGSRYVAFETIGDNRFHEYVIPLQQHPGWAKHQIRAIRLDPVTEDSTLNQTIAIDYIRGE